MKTITKLFGLLFVALIMGQCHKDEEIAPNPGNNGKQETADTLSVKSDSTQMEKFSIIGEKSHETSTGYDVKGALYLETDSGKVAIVEDAAFSVSLDAEGNMQSLKGTGPAQIPDYGFLQKFKLQGLAEAAFEYNTGKYFKDHNNDFKTLPLQDTSHYFFFNLLNLASGDKKEMSVKNAKIGVTSYFINLPQQQIIVPTGSFGFDIPGGGSFSVGEDLAIGISAKRSFHFVPQQYKDSTLNALLDQQKAFADMSGFLYLAGKMSLGDEVPLKVAGNAVLDGDMNTIFTNGFNSASFTYAVNGKVIFGHDLLDLLPVNFETELADATLKIDLSANGTKPHVDIKFAGQFDDNAWMETVVDKISGTNVSQYIPFTGNEGSMFASFGDDWEFYVNTYFAINTPNLGKQPTREGTLHVDAHQIELSGSLAIPYVPGEVKATGVFGYDGKVHLKAKANSHLKIDKLSLKADLDFDIYNDSSTLVGNVELPVGLGKADVYGKVDSEGLTFTGNAGNKDLAFKNGLSIPLASAKIYANIRKANPELSISGSLELKQLNDPLVAVSGTIDSRGVELIGMLNTGITLRNDRSFTFDLPLVNMSLTARTWEGVHFHGKMELPYGFANADADGQFMANRKGPGGLPEISIGFQFSSDPQISFHGFKFPTSGLQLTASTVDGLYFDGQIKLLALFGYVHSTGHIASNGINFTGTYKKELNFGDKSLYSELTFSTRGNYFPFLGDISGSIHTPFGNVAVYGFADLNGGFALDGSIDGCGTVSNPFHTFSGKYSKNFSFSQDGVKLSASGSVCDKACGQSSSCKTVSVSTDINWAEKKFKVGISFPLLGTVYF